MAQKLFQKTKRNYEVVVSICGGKKVGIALAVIEDGVATWVSGETTWPELKVHLKKIDVFRGVWEQQLEKDYTQYYVDEAKAAGCSIAFKRRYQDGILIFPNRREKAEDDLLAFLNTLPVKVVKHGRAYDPKFMQRMLLREGLFGRSEE